MNENLKPKSHEGVLAKMHDEAVKRGFFGKCPPSLPERINSLSHPYDALDLSEYDKTLLQGMKIGYAEMEKS